MNAITSNLRKSVTIPVSRLYATYIIGFLSAAFLAFTALPALAADVVPVGARADVVLSKGVVSATANYTNATTSASDITGATITVPATKYAIDKQYYRACYWADAGKGTATNGTVQLFVNGSQVSAADRQVQSSAGRGVISICYVGARPTASSFIVKLRGVSGDTNTFTVYNAQLQVEAFYAGS